MMKYWTPVLPNTDGLESWYRFDKTAGFGMNDSATMGATRSSLRLQLRTASTAGAITRVDLTSELAPAMVNPTFVPAKAALECSFRNAIVFTGIVCAKY
jgi:hypothetical protein